LKEQVENKAKEQRLNIRIGEITMLPMLATAAFVLVMIAALLSLADSSLVARDAIGDLSRERALARMGFVPQIAAQEIRQRPPAPRANGLAMAQASRARALPLRFALQQSGAA
jgi:hypothetical protein